MQTLLLPQTNALPTLSFRLCDPHAVSRTSAASSGPADLSLAVKVTSAAAQALGNALALTKAEVPLFINAHTGSLQRMFLPQHMVAGQSTGPN